MADEPTTDDVAALETLSRISTSILVQAVGDAAAADWAFHNGETIPTPKIGGLLDTIDAEFGIRDTAGDSRAEADA